MPIGIVNHNNAENKYDDRYVLVVGDTMTGKLVIKPTSGDDSLYTDKRIIIKSGQRLYFDGRPE